MAHRKKEKLDRRRERIRAGRALASADLQTLPTLLSLPESPTADLPAAAQTLSACDYGIAYAAAAGILAAVREDFPPMSGVKS